MFENKNILINQMRTPLNIASLALTELENRLNGSCTVADPNTPFCHLLEFGSSMVAMAIQSIDEKLPVLYPHRATSAEDLYHHMSDFDYLRMYSSPASTSIRLILAKKFLVDKALAVNDNYKQVTIPKDTVFKLGRYNFGIYYPINIRINNYTNTFSAVYDTTSINPLYSLTTNVVDTAEMTYRDVDYVVLTFPIYQFSKDIIEESITAQVGYSTRKSYNNKFYALRIFTVRNGEYIELGQSQSKMVYDASVPTALVRVMPDVKQFAITIPQIYFDDGKMGSKIYIEVYTTLGSMDVNTTNISGNAIAIDFNINSKDTTEYSAVFKNLPYDNIVQIASSRIQGGSDAIDLATLRDRVVNDTLYEKVPITEDEISNFLEDNGFYVKKYIDNVTDRIYKAYRVLTDASGSVVPSLNAQMLLRESYADDHMTFVRQSDNSITILPTTMYNYDDTRSCLVPLTDAELVTIGNMNKAELVDELNDNRYFKSPFHMRVDLSDYYPQVSSYNLMLPEVQELMFDEENYNVAARMTAYEVVVDHLDSGVGGYRFQIAVKLSDDLKSKDISLLKVYVTVRSSAGNWIGIEATHSGSLSDREIFSFTLNTNYRLSADDEISVTNLTSDNVNLPEHLIPLTSKFYMVFLAHTSALDGSYTAATNRITEGVPSNLLLDHIGIYRQHATVRLGYNLNDVIKNTVEVSATSQQYATWQQDVPAVYAEDVYAKDENGKLITTVDEHGSLVLQKLHTAGEQMRDEHGALIWAHRKGEVMYNPSGEPIVAANSIKQYYVDMMFIDAKVFASDRTAELDFVSGLYSTLEGYFTTVRTLQAQLLERTMIHFNVVRSTGTATFNYGDNVTGLNNIELSFSIICFVPSFVKQDSTIQDTIRERVIDAIEEAIQTKTISMNDIFSQVQSKLSDYIDHFTLLGTNGNVSNQTFTIIDDDAQPSIARRLELSEDNIISLVQDLDIRFVALEDNRSGEMTVEA